MVVLKKPTGSVSLQLRVAETLRCEFEKPDPIKSNFKTHGFLPISCKNKCGFPNRGGESENWNKRFGGTSAFKRINSLEILETLTLKFRRFGPKLLPFGIRVCCASTEYFFFFWFETRDRNCNTQIYMSPSKLTRKNPNLIKKTRVRMLLMFYMLK